MRALVLSGLMLIAATYGLARFGYGLFLPHFDEAFELNPALAGLVQAGSFLSYCVAAAVSAWLARRARWGVALAGTTAALGAATVALAPGAALFAAGVIVAGAGAGFATPALVELIQRRVALPRRERAQTSVNAGTGAGIVIAAALLVVAGEQWRLAWAAIALLAAAAAVAVLLADRGGDHGLGEESPVAASAGHDPSDELQTAASDRRSGDEPRQAATGGLRPLAGPLVAALLTGASSAAVWTFGGSLLADAAPLGDISAVAAWATLGALGIAGAWAARIVQAWGLRLAWASTTLAMVVATLGLGLAPGHAGVALAAAALFGATYTAMSGVLIVWAVRIDAARAAAGTVVLFIALAVGQAAGAAAIGALAELLSFAAAFAVAALIGALGLLPVLRAPGAGAGSRPRPPRSSAPRPRATTP